MKAGECNEVFHTCRDTIALGLVLVSTPLTSFQGPKVSLRYSALGFLPPEMEKLAANSRLLTFDTPKAGLFNTNYHLGFKAELMIRGTGRVSPHQL